MVPAWQSAYSDPTAKVWDMTTGKLLLSLTGHTDGVNFIATTLMERGLRLLPGWDREGMGC